MELRVKVRKVAIVRRYVEDFRSLAAVLLMLKVSKHCFGLHLRMAFSNIRKPYIPRFYSALHLNLKHEFSLISKGLLVYN